MSVILPSGHDEMLAMESQLKLYLASLRWRLPFPPPIEEMFDASGVTPRLGRFRQFGWIGAGLFVAATLIEYLIHRNDAALGMLSREFIFPPLAILLLCLLPRASGAAREWLAAAIPLLAAITVALDEVFYATDGRGALWLIAVALWGNLMMRPRFPMACVFSAGVALCGLRVAWSHYADDTETWNAAAVMAGTLVLTLMTKHRMEKDNRIGFAFKLLSTMRVKQLEEANTLLRAAAQKDALTGLHNRSRFDESYPRTVRNAMRTGQPLSVLFVDVDEFKRLNDSQGHARGDEALVLMGRILLELIRRPLDLVVRYGGEEFLVVLPDTNCDEAAGIAERIRRAVQDSGFANPGSQHASLTVSIGVCGGIPVSESQGERLISLADQALYRAKRAGRNSVQREALPEADTPNGGEGSISTTA